MTLEDDLTPLAAMLADALADEKKAKQRADEIKAQIRDRLETEGPGDYAAGLETIKATAPRTVDAKKIEQSFPADTHPYLYRLAPDTKAVRAHLDEGQLEDYLTDMGQMRISLGRSGR